MIKKTQNKQRQNTNMQKKRQKNSIQNKDGFAPYSDTVSSAFFYLEEDGSTWSLGKERVR